MPGQAAVPILGWPCLGGVTSPQPWWPQWVLSVSRPRWQRVLSSSGASPACVPASVDSRGHILARAPCQPLPSPASSVELVLHHPAMAPVSLLPGHWQPLILGVWVLGASDPLDPAGLGPSRLLEPAAEPDSGSPLFGGHRLAGTGVTPKGGSGGTLLSLGAGWSLAQHSTECGMAQHGTAQSMAQSTVAQQVQVSGMAQHTAAGTGPLSPPGSALARAESMTRRGI